MATAGVASLLATSCSVGEKGLADGIGDNAGNAVYMGNVNQSGSYAVLASDLEGAVFSITPRLAAPATSAVSVTLKIDNNALDAYNRSNSLSLKSVMPEDIVFQDAKGNKGENGKITVVIEPGETNAIVQGRLKSFDPAKYSYEDRYAIPVAIESVEGSYSLLSKPISTIVTLNRKIKTSVFHFISPQAGGYTMQFYPKEAPAEEMTEWSLQFIAQFDNVHGNNQTSASLAGGHGFYNRIHQEMGLQVKSENRDGLDTWSGKPVVQGEWTHVTYVYKRSGLVGKLSLYQNGEFIKTFTTSLMYPDGEGWGFGNENLRQYYLREFRFWSRALTPAEIMDKYYLPEDPNSPGLEAYFPMTRESYDAENGGFQDLTGKWAWRFNEPNVNARWEFTDNVVFPAKKLTIEASAEEAAPNAEQN